MTSRRTEILRAISEAAHVLADLPPGDRTSFDVIGATQSLNIPVVFRPLDGLWGACITLADRIQGILVTTKLDLSVQRFTLAHELGHILLGHKQSFDEAGTIGFSGRFGPQTRSNQELAADTFASELLAPRDLMQRIARRQGWSSAALRRGENVYQLALRLGISFKATCWALAAQDAISLQDAQILDRLTVKQLKTSTVPPALITNPWAATWLLTAADSGTSLEAGPDDVFAVRLEDYASAGYLWELVDHSPNVALMDESINTSELNYDQPAVQLKYLRLTRPGHHALSFIHKRPWSGESLRQIRIFVDNYGKEGLGFPRRVRNAALDAA